MNPDKLRAQIGLVSQEPALFDGTISDNIRYGKLNAGQGLIFIINLKILKLKFLGEVNEAARRAEAWNFINTLPDGMHTRVGDRYVLDKSTLFNSKFLEVYNYRVDRSNVSVSIQVVFFIIYTFLMFSYCQSCYSKSGFDHLR